MSSMSKLKTDQNGDIRCLIVKRLIDHEAFNAFLNALKTFYPGYPYQVSDLVLKYTDGDGDLVTFSTLTEFEEISKRYTSGKTQRLNIFRPGR